ncbi:MAG: hypothetical protein DRQ49_15485 [Gammaproteobacteria bacterium]|nr:MAG: hypothetical protein DRQ49_15485 [Gammaproteobacteria bacterium]RKZ38392.1 MAG: hypothetical protein DRQ41_12125 [Gammaproteobacteria bacterium]RKZ74117.1 MAG: hypothetical protein DRQ57_12185 [Gammaproteobacteria bacterium]
MAFRPRNLAQFNHKGEHLMAHKPNTTISDTNQPEKTRVVSAKPLGDSQGKKPVHRSAKINTGVLDRRLRVAEASLQDDPNAGNQDFSEGIAASLGNVDKIRDILFGGQMRDYDKRFKRLEERFNQENMHFREDMFQRLKVLEERMDGEIDSLSEKAKMERQERLSTIADLEHEIKGLKNELNNRITQLDDQFSKDLKNLRQQTHNKIQELALQMRQQNDSVVGLLNQEVALLQEEKVNRADLASFFNELAMRLQRGFEGTPFEESPE